MLYWYVLFIQTGREKAVERKIQLAFSTSVVPYIPMREENFIMNGKPELQSRQAFPGYIFIESDLANIEFIHLTAGFIRANREVLQLCHYTDAEDIALHQDDCIHLLEYYKTNNCLSFSTGFILNDKVCITDGFLKGKESIIRKIDRHKRIAWIEIEFMGKPSLFKVGLEILTKT
jgi:transcriptional antiterminator NusG